jgi:hypothetical protein
LKFSIRLDSNVNKAKLDSRLCQGLKPVFDIVFEYRLKLLKKEINIKNEIKNEKKQ